MASETSLFFKILKEIFPKMFGKIIINLLFSKNKPDKDESEEERKEREKEPDTLLLLGISSAVITTGTKVAIDSLLRRIDKYEMPDPNIDWEGVFGKENISTPDNYWNSLFPTREIKTPKGVPIGFKQGEKIIPKNIIDTQGSNLLHFSKLDRTSIVYGNPMNIRPRMNEKGTRITERKSDIWKGETGHYFSSSGTFVSFSDPCYSFRAAAHLLMSYSKNDSYHNKHCIHDWIYTYCPTKDKYAKGGVQASQDYVNNVVRRVNSYGLPIMRYDRNGNAIGCGVIDEWTYLKITDKNTYIAVIKAMAQEESNTDVSITYLSAVYDFDMNGAQPPLMNYILSNKDKVEKYSVENTYYSSNVNRQSIDKERMKINE